MNEIAQYNETIGKSNLDVQVANYMPLVKRIAYHMIARLPNHIQVEDLVQSGLMGLLDALQNYDSTKGASFNTYASIRIRGAMLDDLRRCDWVPRSVHRNSRKISQAIHAIEKRTQRDPKDEEIAAELSINIDEYNQLLRDTACSRLFAFDDVGLTDNDMTRGLSANIPAPEESFRRIELKADLADKITHLPVREKLVLALYYEGELNLKEIGDVMNVSESRACQLLSQASARLRSKMQEWILEQ